MDIIMNYKNKLLKDLGYEFKFINLVTEGKTNIKKINKILKKIDPKIKKVKGFILFFYNYKND